MARAAERSAMSELRSSGWVARDLEFKRSQKGSLDVRFTLVEHRGYGEASRKQYYEVWAWNEVAQSRLDQRIGKGSRILSLIHIFCVNRLEIGVS